MQYASCWSSRANSRKWVLFERCLCPRDLCTTCTFWESTRPVRLVGAFVLNTYCLCFGEENIVLIYFLSCCSTGRCPLSQCVMLSVPNSQPKWPQEVISLGKVVGTLSADAAARLGLREGIPVAQGGADAFVGMGESTGISQQSGRRAPFVFQGPYVPLVFYLACCALPF